MMKEKNSKKIVDNAINLMDNGVTIQCVGLAEFQPLWRDGITEKSMAKHIKFINENLLALGMCASVIAEKNPTEGKIQPKWEGRIVFDGLALHVEYIQPSHEADGKSGFRFGLTPKFDEELSLVEEGLIEADTDRCKDLFKK